MTYDEYIAQEQQAIDEEMARIAALDKGRSAFFSHHDPAIVEWFSQMVEERKKANHHPASEKKAW